MVALEDKLFVYGTLIEGGAGPYGHPERELLLREAVFVGAAVVPARLYDLGDYPAIVASDNAGDLVAGEVYALADPARTFGWLDPYESTEPSDPAPSDYTRALRTVRMDDGGECVAWVYAYREPPEDARHMPCGSWLNRKRVKTA